MRIGYPGAGAVVARSRLRLRYAVTAVKRPNDTENLRKSDVVTAIGSIASMPLR